MVDVERVGIAVSSGLHGGEPAGGCPGGRRAQACAEQQLSRVRYRTSVVVLRVDLGVEPAVGGANHDRVPQVEVPVVSRSRRQPDIGEIV
jgi:hypothetical protein